MLFKLIFLFFFIIVSLQAQEKTVVLQVNESIPLWSEKLPMGGMGSEIIREISKASGVKTRIDFIPLKRLIADTRNNDIGNPLFYMQKQEFSSVIPIALSYSAFFSYKHSIDDLLLNHRDKPLRIGIIKGTKTSLEFSTNFASFEESNTHKSLFKKLKAGRLDLVLELNLVGLATIQGDEDFNNVIIKSSASPIAILLDVNYPNAKSIAIKYKKGLDAIIENGIYQKILQKYYKKGSIPIDWHKSLKKFQYMYMSSTQGNNE